MTKMSHIGAVVTLSILAAACGGGGGEEATITTVTTVETTGTVAASEPETSTTEPATTESTVAVAPTTTLPAVIRQPLTGEPLDSADEIIDRPALAVKIDNHALARRNHTGLALADIVYEEKVEGSLTRFAAVFHSQDADPLGPIRSGREQDVDILSSLREPLFAWSGGNPGVTALIRASFLTDLNWQRNSGSYYRGPGSSPHNLYSSSDALYALTPDDHPGAPKQQFDYLRDGDVIDGDPATKIDLTIGSIDITWDWNADEGRYERSQEGDVHVDKTYGAIGAENVVVMVVDYKPGRIDSNAPAAQSLGEGFVFVFTDGKVVRGRWARDLAVFRPVLTDERGDPILLTPGQTWVELAELLSPDDGAATPNVDLTFS